MFVKYKEEKEEEEIYYPRNWSTQETLAVPELLKIVDFDVKLKVNVAACL